MSDYRGCFEGDEGMSTFPRYHDRMRWHECVMDISDYGDVRDACGLESTDKERKEAIELRGKQVAGGRNNSPRVNRPRDNDNTNTARTMMTQAVGTFQNLPD